MRLDTLTVDDVVWTPYTTHWVHHAFNYASLYSGHIRWETAVARHFLERYLRQYGYVQDISRPVQEALEGGIDRWFQSHIISSARDIRSNAMRVQHPSQCEDGYLKWYLTISHLCIIPLVVGSSDAGGHSDVWVSDVEGQADDVPPP